MTNIELRAQLAIARGALDAIDANLGPDGPPPPPPPILPAGASLQAAIDAAKPGDTIALTPGAVYTGAVVLRKKTGSGTITITTAGAIQPGRMTLAFAGGLAAIESGTTASAITTEAGAHDYALVGIEIRASAGLYPLGLIRIGAGDATQTSLDQVPAHFLIDRCYIHGDPTTGAKRGIDANGADVTMTRNYISDIKGLGQDTQAISGVNGPGPFLIEDNYLEAAGENVIFGGADPQIPNLIPSDIVIRGNTINKPVEWRPLKWSIKNLLELKNAQRVLIEYNDLSHVWVAAQTGGALLLTVRNQDGTAPWCTVRDVEIRFNVIRHANQGIQILALDNEKNVKTGLVPVSVRMQNVNIHDNLIYDLDPAWGGGSGTRAIAITEGPIALRFLHNTIVGNVGGTLAISSGRSGVAAAGLIVQGNILPEGSYGIKADGLGSGTASWAAMTDAASVFTDNALQPGTTKITYPAGNRRAAMTFDALFMPTPSYLGSDGLQAGVDVSALLAAMPTLDLSK